MGTESELLVQCDEGFLRRMPFAPSKCCLSGWIFTGCVHDGKTTILQTRRTDELSTWNVMLRRLRCMASLRGLPVKHLSACLSSGELATVW